MGVQYFPLFDVTEFFRKDLDVVLFSVSILAFEDVSRSHPPSHSSQDIMQPVLRDRLSVQRATYASAAYQCPPVRGSDVLCPSSLLD